MSKREDSANQKISLYGLDWHPLQSPLKREMIMVQKGGSWKGTEGQTIGNGLEYHFHRGMELAYPWVKFHKWLDEFIHYFLIKRLIGMMGPASCVAGETRILNPITGEQPTIEQLYKSKTRSWVQTLIGPKLAGVPFIKGTADLYEVILDNGKRFIVTSGHRVLTESGFVAVASLQIGQSLFSYVQSHCPTISGTARQSSWQDALHCWQIEPDSQCDCPECRCCDDEPLPMEAETCQYAFPSQACAPTHKESAFVGEDELGHKPKYNHLYPQIFPLSSYSDDPQVGNMEIPHESHSFLRRNVHDDGSFSRLPQSWSTNNYRRPFSEPSPGFVRNLMEIEKPCEYYRVQRAVVQQINFVRRDVFYDLNVPDAHHYLAEGAIHHNTGKSHDAAITGHFFYCCFPTTTTGLYCSTTRELLQQRIWGEVTGIHNRAKALHPWLPGHFIECRLRIVTNVRDENSEARDMRAGLLGVPCKRGEGWVTMSDFAGVKNKHVLLFLDEASLLPRGIADVPSNLDKNKDLKVVPMANPKDIADAFGILCQPNVSIGGWDGGIDQQPYSKVWETQRPDGVCQQRIGTDSPNLDGQLGIDLITQEQIDRDIAVYGKDSLQFTMMDLGVMPRGQGSRRVLTRQECDVHGARLTPFWRSPVRTQIAHLDAAYSAVGGDRCRLYFSEFGNELEQQENRPEKLVEALAGQPPIKPSKLDVFAVKETMNVPIKNDPKDTPADQIARFCKLECEKRGVPPQNFVFCAGMRTALVQSLSQIWSNRVVSIDSMGPPTDRPVGANIDKACNKHYRNFVTEMWWSVRLVVLSGQMKNMPMDAIEDFSQREWIMVGNNLIQVEPKVDMKKKIGRSPDDGDCLSFGVELARRLGFVIRQLKPVNEPKRDDRWKSRMREKSDSFWNAGRMPMSQST